MKIGSLFSRLRAYDSPPRIMPKAYLVQKQPLPCAPGSSKPEHDKGGPLPPEKPRRDSSFLLLATETWGSMKPIGSRFRKDKRKDFFTMHYRPQDEAMVTALDDFKVW